MIELGQQLKHFLFMVRNRFLCTVVDFLFLKIYLLLFKTVSIMNYARHL